MRFWLSLFALSCTTGSLGFAKDPIQFNRDIRPILSDRCLACHGQDEKGRKGKVRFDNEADAKKLAIVPGNPDASPLFQRVTSTNKIKRMPPSYLGHDALSADQIALLKEWIVQGAPWQKHWSFEAPTRATLPPATPWTRNPIDQFLLARLQREGLSPSPEATKSTLLRRAYLDIVGIPPSPEQVQAFLADNSPTAFDSVVKSLLATTGHAEKLAVRWLDAARYADTNGYQSDGPRQMWRWRDYVIESFHKNKPFDQFTIEQIAGDLLPNATLEQKIATGFQRNHRTTAEGGIVDEEFRVEYMADRAETTSTVWLGLTMGCARCHDHKFDPIKQRDFYAMFAFYNNAPEKGFVYNFGNEEPFIPAPTPPQQAELAVKAKARDEAKAKWEALAPLRDKAFQKWQKKAKKIAQDWFPKDALLVDKPLFRDTQFDGKRVVDLGQDIAKLDHRDPYTISAWIKPETADAAIVTRTDDYGEGQGYGLFLVNGKLRLHFIFRWTDLGMRVETEESVALGLWQHVAVTYDGGMYSRGVKLFINGQEQKLKVLFDSNLWPLGHKANLRIGAGSGRPIFKGSIEKVQIWGRQLTPAEVQSVSVRENLMEIAEKKHRSDLQQQKLYLAFEQQYMDGELRQAFTQMNAAKAEHDKYLLSLPTVMVLAEGPKRQAYVLRRGAYDAPGDPVDPMTPAMLGGWNPEWPANRLGLAKWLVSGNNPLTARVQMNRLWQSYFGQGLVKTLEDFGSQGEWPVHAELLDWLAVEFMESGWDLRHMEQLILTSAAYRQSSVVTESSLQRDPENRLISRGPRQRLAAALVRDQALAVSGLLADKVGGPSVKPYQPAGLWNELAGGSEYKADQGEGLYRRSLYTYWRRTIAPPLMVNFDSATREVCSVRDSRTNTPLQALNLMNDVIFLESSRKLAERMMAEGGDSDAQRLARGVWLALARPPKPAEDKLLQSMLSRFRQRFASDPGSAKSYLQQGSSPVSDRWPATELAAYASVASLLLNLDEAVTKE